MIPAPVVVEVDGLARSRGATQATDALLDSVVDGSVQIEDVSLSDYARVRELVGTYSNLRLGFVDAAIVAIAERLDETTVATLDHRHFTVVRPRHCKALTLVP